jgi:hypothetical protein
VSYDIFFVRRDPGQSFADALDATEDSFDGDPGPLGSAQVEQWERITTRARQILDGIEEFATDELSRELSDAETGIQLSMISDEVSITVASARPEQDSVSLMAKVYALARVVEDETGLEGYDPQLQEPITDPGQRLAPPTTSSQRADRNDEESAGAPVPASSTPSGPPATEPPTAKPTTERPWWKFWQ